MDQPDAPPLCPLCDRPIPPGAPQSLHHLVPKLRGGKGGPTVLLHQICGLMYQAHQALSPRKSLLCLPSRG
ncbi:hypothetical protein Dshi_0052 [Dinoroseobacter shibae DFL 12 = DSM 16493]|uniref:HNH endonuclease n=1 Tax=Dinoroseobacter shibae (strain DSM 16493 / NCIMB 14021 / DFL 12) TaxID=398580 RepID=A8LJX5_DINSH|nr:hypothetical protein Dshi_0052 [Dinoroseobacter shibae DFL 12 = DSM 16493]